MQLTLIAATGPSGKALIARALQDGHTLVVYARNPQKVDEKLKEDSRVRIVRGDLPAPSSL
jgi:putative NADH-flavin reductase